jgi:hypothetical protein
MKLHKYSKFNNTRVELWLLISGANSCLSLSNKAKDDISCNYSFARFYEFSFYNFYFLITCISKWIKLFAVGQRSDGSIY